MEAGDSQKQVKRKRRATSIPHWATFLLLVFLFVISFVGVLACGIGLMKSIFGDGWPFYSAEPGAKIRLRRSLLLEGTADEIIPPQPVSPSVPASNLSYQRSYPQSNVWNNDPISPFDAGNQTIAESAPTDRPKIQQKSSSYVASKISSLQQRTYCIGSKEAGPVSNWLCEGSQLVKVPKELSPKPTSLRLSNTAIERLTRDSFAGYQETLRDFSIENSPKLQVIEEATFADLVRLRVIYIFQAPRLISFDGAIVGVHPELTIIRIQQTALRRWPDLSGFKQERILTSIDLDNNKIATLGPKPINVRTELLNLEFNQLSSIEAHNFNGSEIGVLTLGSNRLLTFIHPDAFLNLRNLMKLDLSRTNIVHMPYAGLHQLRNLIIIETYSLKTIPSIFVLPMLEGAILTYAYHCCSFRYPQTYDPVAYEDHLGLQADLDELCASRRGGTNIAALGTGGSPSAATSNSRPHIITNSPNSSETAAAGSAGSSGQIDSTNDAHLEPGKTTGLTTQNSDFEGYFEEESKPASGVAPAPASDLNAKLDSTSSQLHKVTSLESSPAQAPALLDKSTPTRTDLVPIASSKPQTTGSNVSRKPESDNLKRFLLMNIECGELAVKHGTFQNIVCRPEPDAFNPCEDILGYQVLRIAVWFVVAASVFGNLSVIVVLGSIFRRLSVPKFLQLNLAIGDLFMGVYLACLAYADLTTVGTYFNYAADWQHGLGCKVTGAISLFASQLSIYTLSVITFERYYTITYSIDLNMRLQLGWAARIMLIGWIYAFACAILPVFADINSYSKTSICLPMRTTYALDRVFILILLTIDSTAFVIIFACYLRMYLLILRQKTEATAKERTVAMRMALLVSTDFACWAPIIFFSTTALFGQPLISVTNSKILIVFFYPLNSMANPFLYVISTRQYRRDLDYLSSRLQLWRKNLFRRNQDDQFSNNNNAMMINQQCGPSQYPLEVVAAATGVAEHLLQNVRHVCNGSNGANCSGQRIVCTKAKHGKFIIRHQIIPDKYLSVGRARVNRRPPVPQSHRLNSDGAPAYAMGPPRPGPGPGPSPKKVNNDDNSQDERLAKDCTSGASKLVNVSLHSNEPNVLLENVPNQKDLRPTKKCAATGELPLPHDATPMSTGPNSTTKHQLSLSKKSAHQKSRSRFSCSDSSNECCSKCCSRCCAGLAGLGPTAGSGSIEGPTAGSQESRRNNKSVTVLEGQTKLTGLTATTTTTTTTTSPYRQVVPQIDVTFNEKTCDDEKAIGVMQTTSNDLKMLKLSKRAARQHRHNATSEVCPRCRLPRRTGDSSGCRIHAKTRRVEQLPTRESSSVARGSKSGKFKNGAPDKDTCAVESTVDILGNLSSFNEATSSFSGGPTSTGSNGGAQTSDIAPDTADISRPRQVAGAGSSSAPTGSDDVGNETASTKCRQCDCRNCFYHPNATDTSPSCCSKTNCDLISNEESTTTTTTSSAQRCKSRCRSCHHHARRLNHNKRHCHHRRKYRNCSLLASRLPLHEMETLEALSVDIEPSSSPPPEIQAQQLPDASLPSSNKSNLTVRPLKSLLRGGSLDKDASQTGNQRERKKVSIVTSHSG